jgi:hypothetical protein
MPEKEERRINLKQILVTAVITGIVAVATGMLLFNIQRRDPYLTYEVKDTIPFMGDKEKLAIYHVTIRNGGKQIVSDVDCHISVAPALVKETRTSLEPSIPFTEKASAGNYEVHLMNLNPDEEATLSVLASTPGELPSRPKVSLRGQGVTGKEAEEKEKRTFFEGPIFTAVVSAYSVFVVLALIFRLRGTRGLRRVGGHGVEDTSVHSDNQNEILAYLCGLHKLTEDAEAYLTKSGDSSYWSEADRIAALAVSSRDVNETEARKNVLRDLLRYARISNTSVAIIHYNIARIAKAQDRKEECKEHLKEAKDALPKLMETRLSIDPVFHTEEKKEGQPGNPDDRVRATASRPRTPDR